MFLSEHRKKPQTCKPSLRYPLKNRRVSEMRNSALPGCGLRSLSIIRKITHRGKAPVPPQQESREKGKASRAIRFPRATKPDVVVPAVGVAPAAVRYPDAPGFAEPGLATQNAVLTASRPGRIFRRAMLIVAFIVPVIYPLPHVPQLIVEAEAVGKLLRHLVRLAATASAARSRNSELSSA